MMAVRLDSPPLDNTEKLLGEILKVILVQDKRVIFLCDHGQGEAVVARIRVMISRKRKDLERKGKRAKQFRLRDTVHRETHSGRRYDAVVLWRDITNQHIMREELEGMLSNG